MTNMRQLRILNTQGSSVFFFYNSLFCFGCVHLPRLISLMCTHATTLTNVDQYVNLWYMPRICVLCCTDEA